MYMYAYIFLHIERETHTKAHTQVRLLVLSSCRGVMYQPCCVRAHTRRGLVAFEGEPPADGGRELESS